MHNSSLTVKVWGDFACFTRPEMKAERVSYPVMTPSAARGILEAIFWKPEFSWIVRQIDVLNEAFAPTGMEIESARQVVAAYDKAERSGMGSTSLDGRVIDAPVVKRARQTLRTAQTLSRRRQPGE